MNAGFRANARLQLAIAEALSPTLQIQVATIKMQLARIGQDRQAFFAELRGLGTTGPI